MRMSLALEVAKTKAQSDDKIYKPDREAEIVEKRSAGMEEELQLKYVSLLQSMIRASREYQYSEILRQVPEKFPFKPSESRYRAENRVLSGGSGCVSGAGCACAVPALRTAERTHLGAGVPVRPRRQGRYRRCAGRKHNRRHGQRSL